MIKINSSHIEKVLKSQVFLDILDDLWHSEKLKRNSSSLDVFINPVNDSIKKQFLKDLLTLEIKELLSISNYQISTYKNLLELKKVLFNSTNAETRKINLNKIKNYYTHDKSILYFLPSYKDPDEKELKEICRNKVNFNTYINYIFSDFIKLNIALTEIFEYDTFINKYRKKILKEMDINICPYCNISYIINTNEFSTADVDHFLPKSSYPLFGLSFGNFIPSCKSCNQVFKGASITNILNPRERGFNEDAKFYIDDFLNLFSLSGESFSVEININTDDTRIVNLINDSLIQFKIKDIYNSKPVRDQIEEKVKLVNSYRNGYIKTVNDLGVIKTKEEFYEDFFSFKPDEKDFLNKSLGKLKSDLFNLSYFHL